MAPIHRYTGLSPKGLQFLRDAALIEYHHSCGCARKLKIEAESDSSRYDRTDRSILRKF